MLHSFTGGPDGGTPFGGLVRDPAGNLYGTTQVGGAGAGVVFKLSRTGKLTALHRFTGPDGAFPEAGLVNDSAGNLYGTTTAGGADKAGAVFKVDPAAMETVLYSFTGGADGAAPDAALIRDSAGNLYGTTSGGGGGFYSPGVAFELDTAGAETVLWGFGGAGGKNPAAPLLRDASGNLYGTAVYGGTNNGGCAYGGCGVVFKLDAAGQETVLYTFTCGADGAFPAAGLIRDPAGNLYGTAQGGGNLDIPYGDGVVFTLETNGAFSVLYSFAGGTDGASPAASLLRDPVGNLYGTTVNGGAANGGIVFKLDRNGTETVLHTFTGPDGMYPYAGLIGDPAGNLYGTTTGGGASNNGVVFEISP